MNDIVALTNAVNAVRAALARLVDGTLTATDMEALSARVGELEQVAADGRAVVSLMRKRLEAQGALAQVKGRLLAAQAAQATRGVGADELGPTQPIK